MEKSKIIFAFGNVLLALCTIVLAVISFSSSNCDRVWLWILMSVAIGIGLIEIVIGSICHCCHCKTSMIWCEQVMPMLMAIPKENRADCEIGVTYEKKEKKITIKVKSPNPASPEKGTNS